MEIMTEEQKKEPILTKFKTYQFFNFCLGFFGLQFAWQMRIILSGPVTEAFGASPTLFGLIWLAGPVTGVIVQPIIGALSDKTDTRFGRRRPYLLGGALLASLALWGLPNSAVISEFVSKTLHVPTAVFSALLVAAIMIWIIDACINIAQGPYRALVPDIVPQEQHGIANSFFSFAIGLGSVVAAGTAPFLKMFFNYQMSINAQFVMAAFAFSLAMLWTCLTIKEHKLAKAAEEKKEEKTDFIQNIVEFFKLSPEVGKICLLQFFTWIGVMCMFIFFTQYSIHTIFKVPDLAGVSQEIKMSYDTTVLSATNFASICFALFNLVCFLISIPIGFLSAKYGNKKIHIFSLATMVVAFLGMAIFPDKKIVAILMSLAGIGWASILALPFAMISRFIKKGTEGSMMGIFNIFIAGPQVLVCTILAWFINQSKFVTTEGFTNFHWEYAFMVGAAVLLGATLSTTAIREKS